MHMDPTLATRSRPPARGTAALALMLAALLAVRLVHADCAPEPDTDGDGVCDAGDNCTTVANADQKDTYGASSGGDSGDVCETIDAEANITKVKVRGGSLSATPKGKITVKGDFVLLAGENFAPTAVAARVVDGLDLDQAGPAPLGSEAACTLSASGRSIRCKQMTRSAEAQTTASFKISNSSATVARVVSFQLKMAKLPIGGMAFSEPVVVTLGDPGSGIDRVGIISDCAATNGQLTCREL